VILHCEVNKQTGGSRVELFSEVWLFARLERMSHSSVMLNSRESSPKALLAIVKDVVGLRFRAEFQFLLEVSEIPKDHDAQVYLYKKIASFILVVFESH
jgi:hypothetical protein